MAGQLGRHYSSPGRPIGGDVPPPAPGQAYFGYPQPGAPGFGVPQQQQPPSLFADQPVWPLLAIPSSTPSPERRPYRAHSADSRSRSWLHLMGYSLVAIVGVVIGVMVAHQWGGLL